MCAGCEQNLKCSLNKCQCVWKICICLRFLLFFIVFATFLRTLCLSSNSEWMEKEVKKILWLSIILNVGKIVRRIIGLELNKVRFLFCFFSVLYSIILTKYYHVFHTKKIQHSISTSNSYFWIGAKKSIRKYP